VRAGKCYRLCTEEVFKGQLRDMTVPEMQRLCPLGAMLCPCACICKLVHMTHRHVHECVRNMARTHRPAT
jgi:HrpA-like RNA helicase